MDSLFSFPVGLFHPLQHAGLSRRSTYYRDTVDWKSCVLDWNSPVPDTDLVFEIDADVVL
jgi:hypothetical protein